MGCWLTADEVIELADDRSLPKTDIEDAPTTPRRGFQFLPTRSLLMSRAYCSFDNHENQTASEKPDPPRSWKPCDFGAYKVRITGRQSTRHKLANLTPLMLAPTGEPRLHRCRPIYG